MKRQRGFDAGHTGKTTRLPERIRGNISFAGKILEDPANVFRGKAQTGNTLMNRMMIRYRTRPEAADENHRLIEGVFGN